MASSFSVGVTPDPPGLAKTAVWGQGGTAATPSGLASVKSSMKTDETGSVDDLRPASVPSVANR